MRRDGPRKQAKVVIDFRRVPTCTRAVSIPRLSADCDSVFPVAMNLAMILSITFRIFSGLMHALTSACERLREAKHWRG